MVDRRQVQTVELSLSLGAGSGLEGFLPMKHQRAVQAACWIGYAKGADNEAVCTTIGAWAGIGGNLGRRFAREGYHVVMCRRTDDDEAQASMPTTQGSSLRNKAMAYRRFNWRQTTGLPAVLIP